MIVPSLSPAAYHRGSNADPQICRYGAFGGDHFGGESSVVRYRYNNTERDESAGNHQPQWLVRKMNTPLILLSGRRGALHRGSQRRHPGDVRVAVQFGGTRLLRRISRATICVGHRWQREPALWGLRGEAQVAGHGLGLLRRYTALLSRRSLLPIWTICRGCSKGAAVVVDAKVLRVQSLGQLPSYPSSRS